MLLLILLVPYPREHSGEEVMKAPSVISGDKVYIVWPNNLENVNSNYEICFRVSNDNGATFGPITNVSDSNTYDSLNPEISANGDNVIVSYWEKNATSFLPDARASTDGGQTFGDKLSLLSNPFETIS